MNLSKIDSQAVDGKVLTRIYGMPIDNGEGELVDNLILEYMVLPMDAMNVAKQLMDKAAEAVLQPAVQETKSRPWRKKRK